MRIRILSSNIKNISAYILTLLCVVKISAQKADSLLYADEKHFKNVKQLTFNGDNAEAYWSYEISILFFSVKMKRKILIATGCLSASFRKTVKTVLFINK